MERPPLLCAAMPTRNDRLPLLPWAIRQWLAQTEDVRGSAFCQLWIGVDGGWSDAARVTTWLTQQLHGLPPEVLIVPIPFAGAIGGKRNLLLEEIDRGTERLGLKVWILTWDDDDFHGPNRLLYTTRAIQKDRNVTVLGTRIMKIFLLPRGEAWRYEYPAGRRPEYYVGGTMAFRIDEWRAEPYSGAAKTGEDATWVVNRIMAGAVHAEIPHVGDEYVAIYHTGNTASQLPPEDGFRDPWFEPTTLAPSFWAAWPEIDAAYQAFRGTATAP